MLIWHGLLEWMRRTVAGEHEPVHFVTGNVADFGLKRDDGTFELHPHLAADLIVGERVLLLKGLGDLQAAVAEHAPPEMPLERAGAVASAELSRFLAERYEGASEVLSPLKDGFEIGSTGAATQPEAVSENAWQMRWSFDGEYEGTIRIRDLWRVLGERGRHVEVRAWERGASVDAPTRVRATVTARGYVQVTSDEHGQLTARVPPLAEEHVHWTLPPLGED